ncbi:PLD nuclease N-terminal domain-containing protein [Mucilaginibacter sp.]|uniref:PLD nuclease N-terminal domain-containing protein n=1 Tax=Mucilaginibacter sp. TaxID=1882438 RepID=UPI0035BC8222
MTLLQTTGLASPQLVMIFIWLLAMCYPLIGAICILDIVRSAKQPNDKTLWAIIILLIPVIGFISYLAIGRNSKQTFHI